MEEGVALAGPDPGVAAEEGEAGGRRERVEIEKKG